MESLTVESSRPLHRAFERQVFKTPHALALLFNGKTLTFEAVNQQANHLAWSLKKRLNSLGISQRPVISIVLEQGFNTVISALAVLKAGACYFSLELDYSLSDIERILGDSGTHLVICQKHLATQFKTLPVDLFILEEYQKASLPKHVKNIWRLDNEPSINDPAYGIYTVEANQKLKKVIMSHQDAANLMPYCVLLSGATLCIAAKEESSLLQRASGSRKKIEDCQPIYKAHRCPLLPLSFYQSYAWHFDSSVSIGVRLLGALNVAKLLACFNFLIERHEILRTVFEKQEDEIYQKITLPWCCHFDIEPTNKFQLENLMMEDLRTPFDLFSDYLTRFRLFRLDEEHHVLFIHQHSLIADGRSMNILLQELSALYASDENQWKAYFPPLKLQYADFAVWQNQCVVEKKWDVSLAYWRKKLENAPVLDLLTTDRISAFKAQDCKRHHFYLGDNILASLKLIERLESTTLFPILLSALGILLGRYTGQDDILVGSPVAETHPDIAGLMGCFVNMLALRLDLSGSPTFLTVLERVKQTCSEAYAHQDVPFESLVNRPSFFPVVFILHQAEGGLPLALPGIQEEVLIPNHSRSPYGIVLHVSEMAAGLMCCIEYNMGLFSPEHISAFVNDFGVLLKKCCIKQ